jgi:hypothetical protein
MREESFIHMYFFPLSFPLPTFARLSALALVPAPVLDQRGRVRKNAQRGAPAQPTTAPRRCIVCLWITFPDRVHKKAAKNAWFPGNVLKLSTMRTIYDERYVK